MELVILEGALLGAMVSIPIAAVSALRRRYSAGALLGVTGVALQLVFEWLWYSAFVRPEDGRSWLELAFARAGAAELAILMCGLSVTMINVLFLIKQKTLSKENVWI